MTPSSLHPPSHAVARVGALLGGRVERPDGTAGLRRRRPGTAAVAAAQGPSGGGRGGGGRGGSRASRSSTCSRVPATPARPQRDRCFCRSGRARRPLTRSFRRPSTSGAARRRRGGSRAGTWAGAIAGLGGAPPRATAPTAIGAQCTLETRRVKARRKQLYTALQVRIHSDLSRELTDTRLPRSLLSSAILLAWRRRRIFAPTPGALRTSRLVVASEMAIPADDAMPPPAPAVARQRHHHAATPNDATTTTMPPARSATSSTRWRSRSTRRSPTGST